MWQGIGSIIGAAAFMAFIMWAVLSRLFGATLAAIAAITGG